MSCPIPSANDNGKETLTFRWVALLPTKDGRLSSVPGGDAPAWLVHSLVGAQLPINQALQLPASHPSGRRSTRLRSAPWPSRLRQCLNLCEGLGLQWPMALELGLVLVYGPCAGRSRGDTEHMCVPLFACPPITLC